MSARRGMRRRLAGLRAGVALAVLFAATGCDTLSKASDKIFGSPGPTEGQAGYVKGFLGGVVADEPRAAAGGPASPMRRTRNR